MNHGLKRIRFVRRFHCISFILIFLSVIGNPDLFSQNLVPNGNFESHTPFLAGKTFPGSMRHVIHWEPLFHSYATYCHRYFPRKWGNEYLKREGYIFFDSLYLLEGDAMMELHYCENDVTYDTGGASYIKTKLTSPLQIGEVYRVSMWIYAPENPSADPDAYTHFGVYLTRREVFQNQVDRISTDYYFANTIHPGKWEEHSWYIRPLCDLKYITIGAFRDASFTSLFRKMGLQWVLYYVDQVSIMKVNPDTLSIDIIPTPYCEYFEKEERTRILESITSLDVHFPSNLTALDESDTQSLDSFYHANLERKDKVFIVFGHADDQAAENQLLSESRARAIQTYLVDTYNIPEKSILIFGMGSRYPKESNAVISGRAANRRATIRTSNLTIAQVFYRTGLDFLKQDSIAMAFLHFNRALHQFPFKKRIEVLTDPRLRAYHHKPQWKSLTQYVRSGYDVYPDAQKAYFLDSMYFEDQKYRTPNYYTLSGYIEEIDTVLSYDRKTIESLALKADSQNVKVIQKFIREYGYPTIERTGRRPCRGFWYVLLHSGDTMLYIESLPVLEKLCRAGEAEWDLYAYMTDKLKCQQKLPQEYGTQYTIDENNRLRLPPIDNLEVVNARRIRIGLGPLPKEE